MRLINADSLRAKMGNLAGFDVLGRCIDEESTVFDIPDNATNGDVIKAMFPNFKITDLKNRMIKVDISESYDEYFKKEWWNAPYQKGNEE